MGEWWKGIKTLEYTNNPEKAEAARSDGKVVMQWDDELFSIEERGGDDGYFAATFKALTAGRVSWRRLAGCPSRSGRAGAASARWSG